MWTQIKDALPPDREFVLLACPSGYVTIKTVVVTGRRCDEFRPGRYIDHANDDLMYRGLAPVAWALHPYLNFTQEPTP